VRILLDQLAAALHHGGRIEIRGFGALSVRLREPRAGRNPKTGETVPLAARSAIHFKPGRDLKKRVNDSADKAAGPAGN
jgi:integration host factor subunit beta